MRKLAFLYLCLAMTCLTLLRCSLDPLDMPSWDVEINLPVLTETYTLSDLAEDEDAVKVLGDSLYVEVTKQLTEVDLTGRFDFSPYRGGFGARIGAFEVKTIQPAGTYFTIGDLWGDAGAFSGRVEVPPFCFPGPGEPVASGAIYLGDDFAWAQVESGIVDVAVENNLEVPLGDPAGGCPLVLRVSWYGGEWDSVVFDEPVPPGGVSEVEVSLAGRMIANSIGLKMRGGSPGSDGDVDFSHFDEIGIEVAPRGISVSRALASLPRQRFESQRPITIEDSTRVVLAGIASGVLGLEVSNNLPADLSVEVRTDNLTFEGEPFSYTAVIPALSHSDADIDLSGCTLDTGCLPGAPWYGTNTLTFEVVAETPGTTQHVEVASSDSVGVAVEMRDVVFDRVTGTLRPTPVHISEAYDLDLPEICRAVSISDATLVLCISNEAMVGGEFEVEVTGEGEAGVRTAVLTGEVPPADLGGAPSEVEYEYADAAVRDLISMVPDRITVEGCATISGEGRIYSTNAIRGDLTISLPLVFEVEADSVRFEPREFDIPQDVRDEIEEAAREVTFHGHLATDFDLSGSFNVYFGADSAGTYDAPLLAFAPTGGLAPFGPGGARAGEFDVHLDREDLEVLLRERIWVGLEIMLDGGGSPVTAHPDDYIRLEGCLRLVRRVDG